MYSSRYFHKSYVTGNAYITVGDPYLDPKGNPFRQPKKGEKQVKLKIAMVAKNEENGNFSKLKYMAGGYLEATRYLKTQPLENRKKGFGTKDAFKTDEFSNAVRTQQYRESIEKERVLIAANAGKVQDRLAELMSKSSELAPTYPGRDFAEQVPQYDIGRERVTEFDPKSIKDTYYKFDEAHGKKLGLYRPVSVEVGANAWNTTYKPPTFGGTSEVTKFFDKSHIVVGQH